MKTICTIAFLCFVLFQTFAQSDVDVEAIRLYVSNNSPKENERIVNEIYIIKEKMGYEYLGPIHIQLLYNIAHQCPELGGNAVYRARAIYALIANERYSEDCATLPQTRMETANIDTCYKEVHLLNPSLEGPVGLGQVPSPWSICTWTPDTHPTIPQMPIPSDGITYISQGGDSNPNYLESFQQTLMDTLIAGTLYGFELDLRVPRPPLTNTPYGTLSIWLGNTLCSKEELVYTVSITDTVWTTHRIIFTPTQNYKHIILSGEVMPYFSYILIDNLRPVPNPASCDTLTNTSNVLGAMEAAGFKVYPNPNTEGLLMVEWTENIATEQLLIIDALGREVYNTTVDKKLTSKELDIRNLPNGTYVVLLKNKVGILGRKKLIVLKE